MIQAQDRNTGPTPAHVSFAGPNSSGAPRKPLETRGLREVHPKAVAAPLVAAGNFRRGVDEALLDVAFVDLGRRGECGSQRASPDFVLPLASERSPRTPAVTVSAWCGATGAEPAVPMCPKPLTPPRRDGGRGIPCRRADRIRGSGGRAGAKIRASRKVTRTRTHALPGIEDGLRAACRKRSTTISSSLT